MVDLAKALRIAVDTGTVLIGTDQSRKAMLKGEGKMLVLARNCPARVRQDLQHYAGLSGVPVLGYDGTSLELGTVCGKPHPIAAMTVVAPGNSDVLQAAPSPAAGEATA